MSFKRVYVHGQLKKICPVDFYEVDVETAAEAVKAFSLAYKQYLKPIPGRPRVTVRVVGFDSDVDLFCPTDKEEIHLVMSFHGGKNGGFLQIIAGAVLIVIGIILSIIPGTQALGVPVIMLGISMLIGGVITMLSAAPKRDNARNGSDPGASKYLGAPKNTVAIGTRIGIGYGLCKVFGHYISFDIDAVDVAL